MQYIVKGSTAKERIALRLKIWLPEYLFTARESSHARFLAPYMNILARQIYMRPAVRSSPIWRA